jgi:hypothetical protein
VHGRVFIAIDVDGLDEELAARAERFAILPIAGPTFSAQNHLDNFVGGIQHRFDANYTPNASTGVGQIAKEGGLALLNTGFAVLDLLSLAKAAVQSAGRAILSAEGRNVGRNVIEQAERESNATSATVTAADIRRGGGFPKARGEALARDKMCVYCQDRPATQGDHVVPVKRFADDVNARKITLGQARQKANSPQNVVGACGGAGGCNPSKGAKDLSATPRPGGWVPRNPTPEILERMKPGG